MSRIGSHLARSGAFLIGAAYVAIAIAGFAVTGFSGWVVDTDEALLSFDLNGFHNLVHLAVGGILIGASLAREPQIAQGVLIGGGLVYLVVAFLGFTGNLEQLLSIDGEAATDNFLHAVSGSLALLLGLLGGDASHPAVELP